MNETTIKNYLKLEKKFMNDAELAANSGNLELTTELLDKAKICMDGVYVELMEIKPDNKGLGKITENILKNSQERINHPFAIETRKIYSDGKVYCVNQLMRILH